MTAFKKTTSQGVRLWGYTVLVIAAVSIVSDLVWRTVYGLPVLVPLSMGIVIGNISIVLTGVVAISVANALRNVEERLERLEGRTKT
jgi:uncharacterized membrane-anchored protein